jgi:hypothetical protein
MVKPAKREDKKPYVKPTLTLYGTVRELTLKVGTHGQSDRIGTGHPLHNKTAF